MSELVAAYQPHYYPRLHYLARAQQADVFVIYDDVKFCRRSRHHRASIDDDSDEWLTIPVKHAGVVKNITDARVDMSAPWPARHLRTIVETYGSEAEELAPFYQRLCPALVDIETLRQNPDRIAAHVDDSDANELIAECLRLDAAWRERKREYDVAELRERKTRLDERISERKQADPTADIDDLLADATSVDRQLEEAEAARRSAKTRRNGALVELSTSLERGADVDRLPMHELWTVDGVDPEEWAPEVRLADVTVPLVEELLDRFDVDTRVIRSSELAIDHPGDASEYLARLTGYLGGDCYLSGGVGYENYLDEEPFDDRGLDVMVQDWTTTWDDGNVCALDVLYNAEDPGRYVR